MKLTFHIRSDSHAIWREHLGALAAALVAGNPPNEQLAEAQELIEAMKTIAMAVELEMPNE